MDPYEYFDDFLWVLSSDVLYTTHDSRIETKYNVVFYTEKSCVQLVHNCKSRVAKLFDESFFAKDYK